VREGIEYHWTFTSMNTGHAVRMNGFDTWRPTFAYQRSAPVGSRSGEPLRREEEPWSVTIRHTRAKPVKPRSPRAVRPLGARVHGSSGVAIPDAAGDRALPPAPRTSTPRRRTGHRILHRQGGSSRRHEVTLLDPNPNVFARTSRRLAGTRPTVVEADVMKPLPVDGRFDSAALSHVSHCLRGPMSTKGIAESTTTRVVGRTLRPVVGATSLSLWEVHWKCPEACGQFGEHPTNHQRLTNH
jgi:hypothetical protein